MYYFRNYIDVSSSKYINIGIYPDAEDSWEADYYFNGTGRNYAWGSWTSSNNNQYGINCSGSQLRMCYDNTTVNYNVSYGNKRFSLAAKINEFWVNGVKVGQATKTTGNQASRYFYLGNYNGSSYAGNGRVYSFKYWRHGELVRDYIPVQRCEDNVWGFFDKARLVFQGGTQFTGG